MTVPMVVVGELAPLEWAYLARSEKHRLLSGPSLRETLLDAPEPVNLIVTGAYDSVVALLDTEPALIRSKVARLFLLGGRAEGFLPIDPRLKERFPAPFETPPNPYFCRLLTCGEGVIWLPGDICVWRHWDEAVQEASLLSVLPALCLATYPDPTLWLRLFRAVPTRASVDESGALTELLSSPPNPNCYTIVALDGIALSRFLVS